MRILLLLSLLPLLFVSNRLLAQSVCLGQDTTICQGDPVTIESCAGTGADTNVVFINNLTTVTLSDDQYSPAINIGFNFTFYGNTYTQLLISSNGYVRFGTAGAGGFSPWAINNAIPNAGIPTNTAMGPWQDYNPAAFGSTGIVGYALLGTAPNRQFVVVYKDMFMFGTQQEGCSAIVLNETSNEIQIYLDEKIVVAWNGGAAIQGIQNQNGTIAHPVPGRNFPTQWTASLDGQEWIPDGPNNYIQNPIPYKAYVVSNANLTWFDTQGNNYTSQGNSLTVTPNPPANVDSIGYFINYSSCSVVNLLTSDTTWVHINNVNTSISSVDDFCTAGDGEATVTPSGGSSPYTYQWNDPNNQTTQTATGLFEGNYSVTVTDAIGCTETANVSIGDTPITLTYQSTPVSCVGGSDGTATVEINPTPASADYDWFDAPGNQISQTAINLAEGTYNVAVETDNGCQDTLLVTIDVITPMEVDLLASTDVTCNSGNDGTAEISVTEGTAPYSFNWLTGNSNSNVANDLVAGVNTVEITDNNGCFTSFDVNLGEPDALFVNFLTENQIICKEDSVLLVAAGGGGSSPYIYNWTLNGINVAMGDSIYVNPNMDNTSACVTITEQCGSPQADSCLIIQFPDDIVPMVSPSTTGECVPLEVTFENITNSNEIAWTYWDFDNGDKDTTQGLNVSFSEFEHVGLYDITMEVISEFGCRYTNFFPELIAGYRNPEASFYVNPEPAVIYDPQVQGMNQSSFDAVHFSWSMPGAEPSQSSEEFPVFSYPNELGEYEVFLQVTNDFGCIDSAERIVRVINDVLIFAPNTFTPDGNMHNETWRLFIDGIDIYTFHLEVFNRWGEKVFESFNPEGEWDGTYGGKIVKDGTYIWKLQVREIESDKKHQFNGFITVLK